jgi:uncharacterized protein YdaU (DUF1376 family)
MSSALPYMQFYVADYLADTTHLSTLEHGAYLLLIMNYWQRGAPLPRQDEKLAKIARMSVREWLKIKSVLSEFFAVNDEGWHHKRVEWELDAARTKAEKASMAGKASARAKLQRKANSNSTDVTTDVQLGANHPEQNREEQNREDTSEAIASSVVGSAQPEADAPETQNGHAKTTRGTRLPEAWEPLEDDVPKAKGWGLTDDEIRWEHQKFTDYWRSRSGAKGVMLDWDSTWRNWMRKAADDKRNRQQRDRAFSTAKSQPYAAGRRPS